MAKCTDPQCTGVHDNNRYSELCPRSLDRKRHKDWRYYSITGKGLRARTAKKYGIRAEELPALFERFRADPDAVAAEILRARRPELFGPRIDPEP
jgi:hypothetical protein